MSKTELRKLTSGLGLSLFVIATVGLLQTRLAGEQKESRPRRSAHLFGMATEPLESVEVPSGIRALLPTGSTIYVLMYTRMAPRGEAVLVYYPPAAKNQNGSSIPFPEIAVVRAGKLEKTFAYQDDPYWHDVIAAYATFPLDQHREAFGLCVSNRGDGHYSDFLILAWTRGSGYKAVFRDFGNSQAQVRIRGGQVAQIELWSPNGYPRDTKPESQCIWCPQFYEITTYRWQGEKFRKAGKSWRTKEPLEPRSMAAQPFLFLDARRLH